MTNKGIWQCKKEINDFLFKYDFKPDFSKEDFLKNRERFPEDKYIIVQHNTSEKWRKEFKEKGIDATIEPPDMNLGRLTTKGQSKIFEAGLYVAPPKDYEGGVLIAVKPSELKISSESAQGGYCHTPECALYHKGDAIIKAKIPAERVLGSSDYQLKTKKEQKNTKDNYDSHWVFNKNPKALKKKEMAKMAKCIKYDNDLNWCECKKN